MSRQRYAESLRTEMAKLSISCRRLRGRLHPIYLSLIDRRIIEVGMGLDCGATMLSQFSHSTVFREFLFICGELYRADEALRLTHRGFSFLLIKPPEPMLRNWKVERTSARPVRKFRARLLLRAKPSSERIYDEGIAIIDCATIIISRKRRTYLRRDVATFLFLREYCCRADITFVILRKKFHDCAGILHYSRT